MTAIENSMEVDNINTSTGTDEQKKDNGKT